MTINIYNTTLQRGTTFTRQFISRTPLAQSATPLFIALGSTAFTTQTGLSIIPFSRIRAYSISQPLNFMEGGELSYGPGGVVTINVDLIGGDNTIQISDWQLLILDNFTGGTISGEMLFSPASCAGKVRTPTVFTCAFSADPTQGGFSISLTSAQTLALTLGNYDYFVLTTVSGSTRQMVSGTITVVDPG